MRRSKTIGAGTSLHRTFFLAAALLGTVVPGDPAVAVDLRVPADLTLEEAFATALPGDVVKVADTGSPYVVLRTLVVSDGVVYIGGYDSTYVFPNPSAHETSIQLAADSSGSVIDASPATSTGVIFAGFTVGPDTKPPTWTTVNGGGMFIGGGTISVNNCKFRNNVSKIGGGAIQIGAGSAAEILECTFENNETGCRGGAIAVAAGSDDVFIDHCTFTGNRADDAGGFCSATGGAVFTRSSIRLERNTFRQNTSTVNGGALYVRDADLRGSMNLFYDNSAARDGGAIYHENGNGFHVRSLIEGCIAGTGGTGSGGAIYFNGGSNRFEDGFIRHCEALQGDGFSTGVGGALFFIDTLQPAGVIGTEIVGNKALVGGGIAIQGSIPRSISWVSVVSNTILGNSATISDSLRCGAGGIHIRNDLIGEIVNNIIALQEDGCGISCEGLLPDPSVRYNDVWNDDAGNLDPEYGENCADLTNIQGNIKADPRLCCNPDCVPVGTGQPDVQLSAASPCLGTGEGGVDMGAHPGASDCLTPISLEPASWGKIKALYR